MSGKLINAELLPHRYGFAFALHLTNGARIMQTCERCNSKAKSEYGLLDYCAHCSTNLCPSCMENGCCGHVPAESGNELDYPETDPKSPDEEPRSGDTDGAEQRTPA